MSALGELLAQLFGSIFDRLGRDMENDEWEETANVHSEDDEATHDFPTYLDGASASGLDFLDDSASYRTELIERR